MRLRASLIALLVGLLAQAGCIASKRAPPLTDPELARLENSAFPALVIGVVEPEPALGESRGATSVERHGSEVRGDIASDRGVSSAVALIQDLRATGYFREVDFSRQLASKPDLLALANPENGRQGTLSGGGIFTVFSLGLVPTWVTNDWRRSFLLTKPGEAGSVRIDARYSQMVVLSWGMILLLPFRDWTLGWSVVPDDYDDALRLTLLAHRSEIERLLAEWSAQ